MPVAALCALPDLSVRILNVVLLDRILFTSGAVTAVTLYCSNSVIFRIMQKCNVYSFLATAGIDWFPTPTEWSVCLISFSNILFLCHAVFWSYMRTRMILSNVHHRTNTRFRIVWILNQVFTKLLRLRMCPHQNRVCTLWASCVDNRIICDPLMILNLTCIFIWSPPSVWLHCLFLHHHPRFYTTTIQFFT